MAQNYPKWPKYYAQIYALFLQFFFTEKAVPQTFSLLECMAVPWQRLKSAKVSWSSSEKASMNRSLKNISDTTYNMYFFFFMKLIGHDHQMKKDSWCFCWTWLILGTMSNDHYSEYHFEAWQGEVAETSIVEHPVLVAQSLNFWQNDIVININMSIFIIIIIEGRWK